MNKTLINNYESFCSFIEAHTGIIPGHGNVASDFWNSPEKYPCMVIWGIRYNENGPDELYGEFVYMDDFETGKMITEDYVSFETAKLLKEKGFDAVCKTAYETITDGHKVVSCSPSSWGKSNEVKRPTLQMAMKWLRETHNILLTVGYDYECTSTSYCYKIYRLGEHGKPEWIASYGVSYDKDNNPTTHITGWRDYERSCSEYGTYEEACESAIKYCLENLI